MKDIITVAEKDRENQELLVEKVDKVAMVEVARMSIAINIGGKYRQVISNIDMDVAEDLRLISIKKY